MFYKRYNKEDSILNNDKSLARKSLVTRPSREQQEQEGNCIYISSEKSKNTKVIEEEYNIHSLS